MIDKLVNNVNENNMRISLQVQELVDIRDSLDPWDLEPIRIDKIISFLTT